MLWLALAKRKTNSSFSFFSFFSVDGEEILKGNYCDTVRSIVKQKCHNDSEVTTLRQNMSNNIDTFSKNQFSRILSISQTRILVLNVFLKHGKICFSSLIPHLPEASSNAYWIYIWIRCVAQPLVYCVIPFKDENVSYLHRRRLSFVPIYFFLFALRVNRASITKRKRQGSGERSGKCVIVKCSSFFN